MKVAIIVHSKTGNTMKLAQKIESLLHERNYKVGLFDLQTDVSLHPGIKEFQITNLPDLSQYDIILAGAPVWAFRASPLIVKAIATVTGIEGKIFVPFVTMHFPFPNLLGGSVLNKMRALSLKRSAKPLGGVAACKSFHDLRHEIDIAAEEIIRTICK